MEQTKAELTKIEAAKKGNFEDDAKLKDYLLCVAKRIGFIDNAGVPQHSVLKAKVGGALGDQTLAEKLDAECTDKKATPQETVFNMAKCFYEKNPSHANVF